MTDSPRSPARVVPMIGGLAVAAALFAAGMFLESALGADVASGEDGSASAVRELEADTRRLSEELDRARTENTRLRMLTDRHGREAIQATQTGEPAAAADAATLRDALVVRDEIETALRDGNGSDLLDLLTELAALGDLNYPAVAAHWARLANMDAAALDRLGISKIDLASALVRSEGLMKFTLEEADLDPTLRQFTARTLELASTKTRRAILADLDFASEKDKAVLHPLVRGTQGFQDASYVDRFQRLVARTDLYNDSRSSIAFRIAEIGGDAARAAIDRMRANSGGKGLFNRMLPVLESIYAPPATGLLVTNGMKPSGARIGHNDLILEYAGHAIRNRADLTRADSKTRPGQIVAVKLMRNGVEHTLAITVTNTAPGHLHFSSRSVVRR
jgi:hypothetical protein